jgi:hypothetical protein
LIYRGVRVTENRVDMMPRGDIMREQFQPAIEALQSDLADLERQVAETKQVINRLCARAGIDLLYPDTAQTATTSVGALRPDSFYGKSITTAAREYLDMRRAAGLGPATPREIYEALVKGGYTFETKDETNAIIGVRATIRKSSAIFHRLPNGTYGLLSWYPNARATKSLDEDEPSKPKGKSQKAKNSRARKTKEKPPRQHEAKEASPKDSKAGRIRSALAKFLADGPKERAEMLIYLKGQDLMGHEQNPAANLSAYLSRWRDLVEHADDGKWQLVSTKA